MALATRQPPKMNAHSPRWRPAAVRWSTFSALVPDPRLRRAVRRAAVRGRSHCCHALPGPSVPGNGQSIGQHRRSAPGDGEHRPARHSAPRGSGQRLHHPPPDHRLPPSHWPPVDSRWLATDAPGKPRLGQHNVGATRGAPPVGKPVRADAGPSLVADAPRRVAPGRHRQP